jgi:hypothetical protein
MLLCGPGGAAAQPGGPGGRARGGNGPSARRYDPATVEDVTGEVLRVERVPAKRGGKGPGIHLVLKTASGELAVHLGPASYVDKQPMTFAPKDQVEVHGSRVTVGGMPALIAARVTKGSAVLQLRDDNGVPVWRGQGRATP